MSASVRFHLIQLAAGYSRRFPGNKLLQEYHGKPLYQHTLDMLKGIADARQDVASLTVVTQYPEIAGDCGKRGIICGINDIENDGIASSLIMGIRVSDNAKEPHADKAGLCCKADGEDAYIFFMSDQPRLSAETVCAMMDAYQEEPEGILCAVSDEDGRSGNPVIFHASYKEELLSLTGDTGGKQVMRRHEESVRRFSVTARELSDIDSKEDINR